MFQAAEEPLQRLPGVFLKRASAYYAKMDISSLALLAGGLLDEMFETLTPPSTHAANPPKAKVCAAHMIHPVSCRLLFARSSAAGTRSPLDLDSVILWALHHGKSAIQANIVTGALSLV